VAVRSKGLKQMDEQDVAGTPDGEVEGHSMAISANSSIDIDGVALPGTLSEKERLAARDDSAPTVLKPPIR